jgi:hypothetical protein
MVEGERGSTGGGDESTFKIGCTDIPVYREYKKEDHSSRTSS